MSLNPINQDIVAQACTQEMKSGLEDHFRLYKFEVILSNIV